MGPINRGKHVPMRDEAGRFLTTRHFVNSPSATGTTMKTITVKGKKFKRRSLDTPRIGKKTSIVWNFFKALPHENGISRAVCLLCKVIFKNPGGSTTGMRGHLERKHPGVIEERLMPNSNNVAKFDADYKPPRSSLPALKSEKVDRSITPPPPHLSIENGAITAAGEGEIYEDSMENGQSTSSNAKRNRILPGPPPEVYSENTEDLTRSVVMHLVSTMLPVNHVQDAFFKKIFELNGTYIVETENQNDNGVLNSVVEVLDEVYKEAKDDIKRKLHDKPIGISFELWVKANNQVYVLITANYVNREWTLESYFLGLRHLPEMCSLSDPETVTSKVSQALSTLLNEYEIKIGNVVHVLAHTVPFSVNSNILNTTTWPCLNDTIQRSYELLNGFAISITDCDVLNNALKIGKQVLPGYKDLKKHPGKLMDAMKTFLSTHSAENLPLKVEDLDECVKIQEPFSVILDSLLQHPVMPASSILPLIFLVRNTYENQITKETSNWSKEQRQELTAAISNHIETSYKINLSSSDLGDPMLAVCSFLDPRYKKLRFLTEEQRNFVYDTVTELLHELGEGKIVNSDTATGSIISVRSENPAYANGTAASDNTTSDPLNPSTSSSSASTSQSSALNSQSAKLAEMLSAIIDRQVVKLPNSESMEELNNYWDAPVAPLNMDPYQWWSYNHERYPKLAELAKRYLCIRANSTLARLTFTGAGKKFFDKLANIEEEYVEKLQVLRRYHALHPELTETEVPQPVVESSFNIKTEAMTMETVDLMDEDHEDV